MESPFEIYTESHKELVRFFEFIYKLEPAGKLGSILKSFDKVSRYWRRHHSLLINDSLEWKEFNKRFNKFSGVDIVEAERYLSIGADKIFDYTEVVAKQLLVMIISILEVYLTQQFELLISIYPLRYLDNLEKEKDKEFVNLQLEVLNKLEFQPKEISNYIYNKSRANFQNAESILKQYRRFNIDLEMDSYLEMAIDARHVIVHRNGKPDKKFQKKYDYEDDNLSIGQEFIQDAIRDMDKFVNQVESKSKSLGV